MSQLCSCSYVRWPQYGGLVMRSGVAVADGRVGRIADDGARALRKRREHAPENDPSGKERVPCLRVETIPRRRYVCSVKGCPQGSKSAGVVVIRRCKLERERVCDTQVATDAMPQRPGRNALPSVVRIKAFVQQNEAGRLDGQGIDVDAVQAAFHEVETILVRIVGHGQVEGGLQEHTGAASGIEDGGRLDPLAERPDGLPCDVLGNVRGGVEDPSGPLCVPGLPCARSLHHARPAAGAVRVKHVWQEIPERVVVVDCFERLGRLAVGELDDGVGKSAGGGGGGAGARETTPRHRATMHSRKALRCCGRQCAYLRDSTPPEGLVSWMWREVLRAVGWPAGPPMRC